MSEEMSCGAMPEEVAADAAAADRETLEFEAAKLAEREAELAKMDRQSRYNERNRALRRCRQAERRARKLGALPSDQTEVERDRILTVYKTADALSEITGVEHEVDHIRPLQPVCRRTGRLLQPGLHVVSNLRPIPKSLNRKRGNWWISDKQDNEDWDDDLPF